MKLYYSIKNIKFYKFITKWINNSKRKKYSLLVSCENLDLCQKLIILYEINYFRNIIPQNLNTAHENYIQKSHIIILFNLTITVIF